jgi:hypothetical protein
MCVYVCLKFTTSTHSPEIVFVLPFLNTSDSHANALQIVPESSTFIESLGTGIRSSIYLDFLYYDGYILVC